MNRPGKAALSDIAKQPFFGGSTRTWSEKLQLFTGFFWPSLYLLARGLSPKTLPSRNQFYHQTMFFHQVIKRQERQKVLFHSNNKMQRLLEGSHCLKKVMPQIVLCRESQADRSGRPRKGFVYLPLGPHFARLFGNANLSQVCQAHSTNGGLFSEIQDSPAFRQ